MVNENIIAYNSTILRHLVCAFTAVIVVGSSMECAQLALDILLNIANKVDYSGRKRTQVIGGYVEDIVTDEVSREMLRLASSHHLSHCTTFLYLFTCRALVAVLYHMIHEKYMINRYYLVKALDLLCKLAKDNEKESFFKGGLAAPVLDQLSLLLAVGLGRYETNIIPESYAISGDLLGKSRPPLSCLPPLVVQIQNLPSITSIPLQALLLQQQQAKMNETSGVLTTPTYVTSDHIDLESRD